MVYIALYWGVLVVGYFLGYKNRSTRAGEAAADVVMTISIGFLLFIMGLRMGSNESIISNLGNIGWISALITLLLWAGAVIAITLTRKILGIDKWGFVKGGKDDTDIIVNEIEEFEAEEEEKAEENNIMVKVTLIGVVIGLIIGFFWLRHVFTQAEYVKFTDITGYLMTAGLCIMMFVIGYGMGLSGTVIKQFKHTGARVLAIPVAILIGTTVMALVIGLILSQISIRESLAIAYGFGWYTFAPITITNAGHELAGAISFLYNIFRELGGIVLIPMLANKIGYIEVTSLPGSASMDVCLPIIQRATRDEIVAYSFIVGLTDALLTTILVPLVIGA